MLASLSPASRFMGLSCVENRVYTILFVLSVRLTSAIRLVLYFWSLGNTSKWSEDARSLVFHKRNPTTDYSATSMHNTFTSPLFLWLPVGALQNLWNHFTRNSWFSIRRVNKSKSFPNESAVPLLYVYDYIHITVVIGGLKGRPKMLVKIKIWDPKYL
jgi:hypothetical protein